MIGPRPRAALAALGIAALAMVPAGRADDAIAPVFGVRIPDGYRQWPLIAVTHVAGSHELKGILGNPLAAAAHRAGTVPFPDGAVLAKLSWHGAPLAGFDGVAVPGAPVRLEIMVKNAQAYEATGGWGYGRFVDGKPADAAQHQTCFGCHDTHARAHDFVFTHWAP